MSNSCHVDVVAVDGDTPRGRIRAMQLEFGDAVLVVQSDGTEEFAHFLAGPRAHEGSQVVWVCDDHEWTNATVHFGRDPEGTPYPPECVRPYP